MVQYALGPEYAWIVAFAFIWSFWDAFCVGANDVANSFSSSVGAKSLTLKQAVLTASIFEFAGAIGMGGNVSTTVRDNIVNAEQFKDQPELLMYGLMVASFTTAIWVTFATYYEFPVSTTQSTIGALVGVGVALRGLDGPNWWSTPDKGEKKAFESNVVTVVLTWFVAPILAALASNIFYVPLRAFVFRSNNSFNRSFYAFPVLVFVVVTILSTLLFVKGGKQISDALAKHPVLKTDGGKTLLAFVCGIGAGLIALASMPWLRSHVDFLFTMTPAERQRQMGFRTHAQKRKDEEYLRSNDSLSESQLKLEDETAVANQEEDDVDLSIDPDASWKELKKALQFDDPHLGFFAKVSNLVSAWLTYVFDYSPDYDVVRKGGSSDKVVELQTQKELFDTKTETVMSYLQVLSATCAAFSHGANDIANAVGPLSGAFALYIDGSKRVDSDPTNGKTEPPSIGFEYGLLAYAATALVLGLLLFGSRIIACLGTKLCSLTPARGLCVELGYSLVVVLAAGYALPVSTTQVQTGAVIGIGLADRAIGGVNWQLALKIFIGWVLNVVVSAVVAGLIVAQAAFAPTVNSLTDKFVCTPGYFNSTM